MTSKNMPLVSVVIPTYNRAYLIERSIKSVLNQTYQNLEIIVVDDGSEDNTEEIVKSFNDSRIIFTRHEKNRGVSAARNTGIKLCNGNYIAFNDSDDEWLEEKIRKQITIFLENSDESIGVVYSGFFKIRDNIRTYIPSQKCKKEGDIYFELLKGNLVAPPAAMVKKICFEKAGLFDENLSTLEDWELFIRISKYFKFKYIPEALVLSYYTSNGVNERGEKHKLKTYNAIVNRNMDKLSKNKRLLHNFYSLMWQINFSKKFLIKAIGAYPLDFKLYLKVLIALFGKNNYKKVKNIYSKIRIKLRKSGNRQ